MLGSIGFFLFLQWTPQSTLQRTHFVRLCGSNVRDLMCQNLWIKSCCVLNSYVNWSINTTQRYHQGGDKIDVVSYLSACNKWVRDTTVLSPHSSCWVDDPVHLTHVTTNHMSWYMRCTEKKQSPAPVDSIPVNGTQGLLEGCWPPSVVMVCGQWRILILLAAVHFSKASVFGPEI
jgi:hypothetical protein